MLTNRRELFDKYDDNQISMESPPKLGREGPVRVVTIFAAAAKSEDDKRHLLACDGLLEVHDLDASVDLLPQWEALSLPLGGPDLILTKLHKAIGSKDTDPQAAKLLSNYESLRRRCDVFERLELASIDQELILANRFPMQDLIDEVCEAVNLTLRCGQSEEQRDFESRIRSSIGAKLGLSHHISASLGGGDRSRAPCRKPPSIQIENPAELFSNGVSFSSGSGGRSLPPFPLIVKPCSTAVKSMAMVVDEVALRHFSEGIGKGGVVIEQFVQHDNVIMKVYVIGKEIWVVRRPSLPNVTYFSADAIREFGVQIGGTFVPLENSPAGGYVIYLSNKMPKSHISSKPLEECEDLDVAVFRLLVASLAEHLGFDLFGFDALVESQTRNVFVVDVNFLPGYKGIPSSNLRLSEWLVSLATRRAFKTDCLALDARDVVSLSIKSDTKGGDLSRAKVDSMVVTPVAPNRLFEVSFAEVASNDSGTNLVHSRHTLVKFFRLDAPPRLLADEERFVGRLAVALAARGLAPPFVKDISTSYFGRPKCVGMVRHWVEGRTLHQIILDADDDDETSVIVSVLTSDRVFSNLGEALAKFHLLGDDADFRREIVERHFPAGAGNATTLAPMLFSRLEEWRLGALISLVSSPPLRESSLWGDLYRDVLESGSRVVAIAGEAVDKVRSKEALRVVFSHNDCSPSNIVFSEPVSSSRSENGNYDNATNGNNNNKREASRQSGDVYLIDEEWAAPNFAVYDFANFVMTMTMMRSRGFTRFSDSHLRSALESMAMAYFERMKTSKRDDNYDDVRASADPSSVNDFLADVWAFVPVTALTHCFSNLIHASKEGQLTTSVPSSTSLFDAEGTFNWLRHATDHLGVFRKFS